MGGKFVGESVEAIGQVTNILEEIVVGDESRDSGEESRCGGDKSFGDTRSDGAKAGGAGGAEPGEGVNDAPNGAEKADEGSNASGGGEPGHTFFDAADFVSGCQLHADSDGLERFNFLRGRVAGAGHL